MVTSLTYVLENPGVVSRVLEDALFGVLADRVLVTRDGGAVVDFTFSPLPELKASGYLNERARISIRPDGSIYAFPLGPERPWKHRQPSPLAGLAMGHFAAELCLYYPGDPIGLKWTWAHGLEQYVTRVHRHLFYEEFYRREGYWPIEDAPHHEPSAVVHPVRTAFMQREARRWVA